MFICIYCQKSEPEVRPSEAHLFPMAMGGVTSASDIVCQGCNGRVNSEVEMPAISSFAFFQSIWGIKGRRSQRKCVPAIARFADNDRRTYLNDEGEPASEIVFTESTQDGKRAFRVFGTPEKSQRTRQRISNKYPNIQWTEMAPSSDQPLQIIVPFSEDLRNPTVRRLAAKIAFERFASIRSSLSVLGKEFQTVRDFILAGDESTRCCGVHFDSRLFEGLLHLDLPKHAVVIIEHPSRRELGAFVAIYGLFYFWVLLSAGHTAFMPFDDILVEHAQAGVVENPKLRGGAGSLVVNWGSLANIYTRKAEEIETAALRYASEKFHKAADEFYGQDQDAM
jgi:HNH endonuclease